MSRPLFIVLFTSSLVMACGSKQKTRSSPVQPNQGTSTRAVQPSGTENATGDLRDAILHLRRVHFAFDTDTLMPEARDALSEAAQRLRPYRDVHLYVEGHCDDRGTSEYNVALGERRARAAIDFLTRMGIDSSRLHVLSYGEERPLAQGEDSTARAHNRRVDFSVMRGSVELIVEQGIMFDDRGRQVAARN